jgi:hypothetical protein
MLGRVRALLSEPVDVASLAMLRAVFGLLTCAGLGRLQLSGWAAVLAFALPGDALWNEDGVRWSWKVMVREKNGAVTFLVRDPSGRRQWQVSPNGDLLPRQAKEMSGPPHRTLQRAHHAADAGAQRGIKGAEVRADTWGSLNGRPPHRLIDPTVDLAKVDDSPWGSAWVLPGPEEPPLPAFGSEEAMAWR